MGASRTGRMGQESPVPLFAAVDSSRTVSFGKEIRWLFLGPEDDVPFNENVSLRVCIVSQYAGANMIREADRPAERMSREGYLDGRERQCGGNN